MLSSCAHQPLSRVRFPVGEVFEIVRPAHLAPTTMSPKSPLFIALMPTLNFSRPSSPTSTNRHWHEVADKLFLKINIGPNKASGECVSLLLPVNDVVVLVSEGNGNYRAAGSDVLHQLPKEVPQHHLWTPSHWSAAKCKHHHTAASPRVSFSVLFSTFLPFKLTNGSCCSSWWRFQTCCVSSLLP